MMIRLKKKEIEWMIFCLNYTQEYALRENLEADERWGFAHHPEIEEKLLKMIESIDEVSTKSAEDYGPAIG